MFNILVIVVLYERIIHSIENSVLCFFSCLIVSLEAAKWVITHYKVHLRGGLHDCISPRLHGTPSTCETRQT